MALTANKYQKEAYKTFMNDGIEEFLRKVLGDTVKLEDLDWESRDFGITYLKILYSAGKLNGESGEVAEEIFKSLRDGGDLQPRREATIDELGDVIWYVAALCTLLDISLEDLMEKNLGKVRAKFKKAQEQKYGKVSS
jgi:NTP pyrophosphatase (non-canonical NTP hydrolase)